MRVLGVDPGLSGALVVIDKKKVVAFCDMPITQYGKNKMVNGSVVADFIEEHQPRFAVIEHQQSMGEEGRGGLFRFATAFGVVVGVVQCMTLPHVLVPPAKWKRSYGLIGMTKKASHAIACRLFPSASKLLYGPRGGLLTDRAEALLLAAYKHG